MLRNRLLILACLLGMIIGATAQEQEKNPLSRFYGGVRVGFTASQISGDDLSGFHKVGAHAGLFVNHAIHPSGKLKLQLELDFTMKGSHSYTPKNQPSYNFYSLTLGYVEMPVMVVWTAGKWTLWGKPFQFELEIGPAFGVNVFSREREANGLIVGRPPFRWYEVSGIAGISLMVADHHSINFRYENSIVPVRIPTWVYGRVVMKQFNSLMTFSYCYQF
ncbi:MAG: PorT family protein [Bacteroidales bacterium]|jgi:hypothetical protein|nr:PorT family protein [Bacteroidales bacterium]